MCRVAARATDPGSGHQRYVCRRTYRQVVTPTWGIHITYSECTRPLLRRTGRRYCCTRKRVDNVRVTISLAHVDCLTCCTDDCDNAHHSDFPRLGGLVVTQFVSNVIRLVSVDSKRVSAAPWSRANQVCEDPRCNIVQRENSLIMS